MLEATLAGLPERFPGPGGACAVLRDGRVVGQRAWGWADAERRIPFTAGTLFRICSITKQFTCGLVLDQVGDPAVLDDAVAASLPGLDGARPLTRHLCHNQSGLRDYWTVAMLHGSPAEGAFSEGDADALRNGTRSLQFAPGTRYSYSNGNFRILSDLLQARTGRSFGELLRARLFDPAGMPTATVVEDTAALPDGTQGYEGSQALGFRPAVNRVFWTGDAAIAASLDDMIAWERHIDATRDDPASLYRRLSAPVTFDDGTPAQYGFGLGRRRLFGRTVTSHAGALRGWRSVRLHSASDRVSVVVMFNHMGDVHQASLSLLGAILGENDERSVNATAIPPLAGAYVEPETELSVRIGPDPSGKLLVRYDRVPDLLDVHADGTAGAADGVRIRQEDGSVWMDRALDHQSTRLVPRAAGQRMDIAGLYRCEELQAVLTVADAGGILYGAFSGILGSGRMEALDPVADDLWALPCPRALDHLPPGDWTLSVHRDDAGRPASITVGCWLARGLRYDRVSPDPRI